LRCDGYHPHVTHDAAVYFLVIFQLLCLQLKRSDLNEFCLATVSTTTSFAGLHDMRALLRRASDLAQIIRGLGAVSTSSSRFSICVAWACPGPSKQFSVQSSHLHDNGISEQETCASHVKKADQRQYRYHKCLMAKHVRESMCLL